MSDVLTLSTDVLVIGGGPAATWAAIHARDAGAEVIIVDKGYCGASGTTAPAGTISSGGAVGQSASGWVCWYVG